MPTKWYVISEAVADGEGVEVHRIQTQPTDDTLIADPAKAQAEDWAHAYSDQTGKPTAIDIVWENDEGAPEGGEMGEFYYDPNFPERDPHQHEGY